VQGGHGASPVVLVVDDDPEARGLCEEILREVGFRVEWALDGLMAIERARTTRPSVIVMDFHMPGLDGWETTRYLRADPSFSSIPIIALTADSHYQTVVGALDAGCDCFLVKPVPPEQLVSAVRRGLSHPWPATETDIRGRRP
jgi:two-component system cell cycle response regulator DivK